MKDELKTPGRPSDPNSKRQIHLREMEAKKSDPNFKLGRPIVAGSKRQMDIAKKAEQAASGVIPQKGRPKMSDEQKLAAKEERLKRAEALKAKGNLATDAERKEIEAIEAEIPTVTAIIINDDVVLSAEGEAAITAVKV